jgi:catechol 2,3-dioxygenase-like lactoylglutathione lyase family enzyme
VEKIVDELLGRFERGGLSRRQLVQTLALGMAAAAAPPLRAASARKGFRAVAVNHISFGVQDYARTRDFYAELLGLPVSDDDGSSCALKIGADSFLIPRKTRKADGSAFIDHMCYTIEDWDRKAVEDELRARGFDPRPDTDESFHIKDPDGFGLQIGSSKLMYVPLTPEKTP